MEYLEKILNRVEELDAKILKGVEELIQPILVSKMESDATLAPSIPTEAVIAEEKPVSSTVAPALSESVTEITQLLSDVEALKKEMQDADWKQPPADVIDGLISDVRDLKEAKEKKSEAVALTEGSLEHLETATKTSLKALRREVDELQEDVSTISTNLGHLFTYVYRKDHGHPAKLRGGMVDGKFVIRAVQPKNSS